MMLILVLFTGMGAGVGPRRSGWVHIGLGENFRPVQHLGPNPLPHGYLGGLNFGCTPFPRVGQYCKLLQVVAAGTGGPIFFSTP